VPAWMAFPHASEQDRAEPRHLNGYVHAVELRVLRVGAQRERKSDMLTLDSSKITRCRRIRATEWGLARRAMQTGRATQPLLFISSSQRRTELLSAIQLASNMRHTGTFSVGEGDSEHSHAVPPRRPALRD
jgi:hypothetical protein